MQIQALIAKEAKEKTAAISKPNTGSNIKVAKLQMFNREAGNIPGFLMVYKGGQQISGRKIF